MWIALALLSALCLGFYDVMKKLSVKDNDVLTVLLLNTLFSALLMSPVIIVNLCHGTAGLGDTPQAHLLIIVKSLIVLSSWLMGYFAIKHLPLTIQGPINASRPVMVLVGAVIIFGERLNGVQWTGILLGFASLFLISRIGSREGFALGSSRWILLAIGAAVAGAVSSLYDKYLLGRFAPLDVQAWYTLYQLFIMGATLLIIRAARSRSTSASAATRFRWRWTILFISVFLTVADIAYFYALSQPQAMVSIVSMIRRGSVIVPFLFGITVLHERHVRGKLVDLAILLVSLGLLVIGSTL